MPQGNGVAAMIGSVGPPELVHSILYSEDGFHFKKTHDVIKRLAAGGASRLDNFSGGTDAERINWGVSIGSGDGSLPYIQSFDVEWPDVK